jgi:hypothetical protein
MAKSDKTYTEVEQERIDAVNRYGLAVVNRKKTTLFAL